MYNKNFQLDPADIKIIESALRTYETVLPGEKEKVIEVLAKIHNQKVWYRPKDQIYVSG